MKKTPKHPGGRPTKYAEPCRPITVTLPDRILQQLAHINPDRGRAIVKCVEAAERRDGRPATSTELIELTPGKALIVVGPSAALRRIPWLRLVEIAPLRYLLVLPSGTAVEVLEVTLQDLLAGLPSGDPEAILIADLLDVIRRQRRGSLISTAELILVDIPGRGHGRKAVAGSRL